MSRSRVAAAIAGGLIAALVLAAPVRAETRRVSIGNYYYEDDETNDRKKIVVAQGDQVAFTVREGVFPPHTVEVDELNIHSGDLLLGETYTTPQLNRAGTFLVYCRPHRERGHISQLVVQAAAPATTAPPATAQPSTGQPPAGAPVASPTPTSAPTAAPTLAPAGVTTASPDDLRRPVAVDPDSLEGLTGRARSTAPWTRSLWFLLIASVPAIGAAGFAVRRELARGSAQSSAGRPRSPARSPRSSGPKASGSGRTSRGRRR